MNKIFSFSLILLTALAVVSCDKDDDNADAPGWNDGKRLVKSVYYNADGAEMRTVEWTYGANLECATTYKDGTPVEKTELRKSDNASSEHIYTWQSGNWEMTRERIEKKDSQGRILSVEVVEGNPGNRSSLTWYTYSGDSTIVVISIDGKPESKLVSVKRGGTTEVIHYLYAGDYQWKEIDYHKSVITYVSGNSTKPLSWVTYNREGNEISRYDYEWDGENYKEYRTGFGVKRLYGDFVVDGNTKTRILYDTDNLDDADVSTPYEKIVTKEMDLTIEEYTYRYSDGWVLRQKKVDYYEKK